MKLAFIFPGQGSQSIGMLAEIAKIDPIVTDTYAVASEQLGYDLWDIVSNGPIEKLNETSITQPAMLAAGVAMWRIWNQRNGPTVSAMAGHSLGEYSALVCAGALKFEDAVTLVADRGKYMQEAVPKGEGLMAAILGLDDDSVAQVCEQAAQGEIVVPVNFNAPGQVVIAGHTNAVKRAVELAKQAAAKRALLLSVSVPSHCQLMEPASHDLAERLQKVKISMPNISVINNANVTDNPDPQAIREALILQICNPVQWVATINRFSEIGIDTLIECGPGKVLLGLNKRINRNIKSYAIFSPETLNNSLEEMQESTV
jgi:[acyl-carrier-protein] S-malonyltransferase